MINYTVEHVKDIYSPSFLETIYTCFIVPAVVGNVCNIVLLSFQRPPGSILANLQQSDL